MDTIVKIILLLIVLLVLEFFLTKNLSSKQKKYHFKWRKISTLTRIIGLTFLGIMMLLSSYIGDKLGYLGIGFLIGIIIGLIGVVISLHFYKRIMK